MSKLISKLKIKIKPHQTFQDVRIVSYIRLIISIMLVSLYLNMKIKFDAKGHF